MRTEALNAAGFTAPQQDAVAGMEPKHLGAPTQTYDALALLVINKTTSAVKVAGAAADPNIHHLDRLLVINRTGAAVSITNVIGNPSLPAHTALEVIRIQKSWLPVGSPDA